MRTFTVKNFERFQHYKDRAPPWIKLYNELLEDYDFGRLPDAQKGQLISIWLLASRMENKLPLDPVWIASKINATSPVDLDALLASGFIIASDTYEAEPAEQIATPAQRIAKANGFGSRHISDEVKRIVWQRDAGHCCECGSDENIEYDHKHPVSKGGSSGQDNIQLLCRTCNRRKRAKLATHAQPSAEPREREEGEGEKRQNGAADAANSNAPPNPEKLYFDASTQLGKNGRSLAGALLKAKGGNVLAAHSALLTAFQKSSPEQYIGAIIKGRGNAPEDLRARGEAW